MTFTKIYKDDYPLRLIKFMQGGFSFYSFGAEVTAGQTTLDNWLVNYEEFKDAREIGELMQLKFFERNQALGSTGATAKAKIDGAEVIVKPNSNFNNYALSRLFKKYGYCEKIITEDVSKASKLIIVMGDEDDQEKDGENK